MAIPRQNMAARANPNAHPSDIVYMPVTLAWGRPCLLGGSRLEENRDTGWIVAHRGVGMHLRVIAARHSEISLAASDSDGIRRIEG